MNVKTCETAYRCTLENIIVQAELLLSNIDCPELAAVYLKGLSEQYHELEHLTKLKMLYTNGVVPISHVTNL